jgi:hypothetical protein
MVEQLTQRTTLVGPSRLTPIDRIECLVKEETDRPTQVNPWWAILIQRRCVPEQSEEVCDDKAKARERDLIETCQRTNTT